MLEQLSLFVVGLLELFLGTVDFKFIQKNRIAWTAIAEFVHVYIWAYIISRLFIQGHFPFDLVTSYGLGCVAGKVFALKAEPFIDKKIMKIQRGGRKIRRGFWFAKRK